jgi:hypothetical protein
MRPEPGADRGAQSHTLPRCAAVQARLFDYLDGALPAAEREPIRAHLEVCAACRREAALCQQSERALASARSAIPSPGDLRADFYARLAASDQTAARRAWLSWKVVAPALATCALAVLLIRPALHTVWKNPAVAVETAPGKARSRPAPTQKPVREGGLWAFPAANEFAGRGFSKIAHTALRGERKRSPALKPRPMRPTSLTGPIVVASAAVPMGNAVKETDVRLRRDERLETGRKDAPVLALAKADRAEAEGALPEIGAPLRRAFRQADTLAARNALDAPVREEVVLKVVDEERGFTACTRLHSQTSDQDGVETVTVETGSVPMAARLPER